jgi:hypothetical protein
MERKERIDNEGEDLSYRPSPVAKDTCSYAQPTVLGLNRHSLELFWAIGQSLLQWCPGFAPGAHILSCQCDVFASRKFRAIEYEESKRRLMIM